MPKFTAPDDFVRKILQENSIDPNKFTVHFQDEDTIRLRNYNTRCDITIHQGDKPWSKRI